jgi:hypothetical protein
MQGVLIPVGQVQIRGYDMNLAGMEQVLDRLQRSSVRKVAELTVRPVTTIEEKPLNALRE